MEGRQRHRAKAAAKLTLNNERNLRFLVATPTLSLSSKLTKEVFRYYTCWDDHEFCLFNNPSGEVLLNS